MPCAGSVPVHTVGVEVLLEAKQAWGEFPLEVCFVERVLMLLGLEDSFPLTTV